MGMRRQWLIEAGPFLTGLLCKPSQKSFAGQYTKYRVGATRDDVRIEHHVGQSSIAVERMIEVKLDDRLLFLIRQPVISGDLRLVRYFGRSKTLERRILPGSAPIKLRTIQSLRAGRHIPERNSLNAVVAECLDDGEHFFAGDVTTAVVDFVAVNRQRQLACIGCEIVVGTGELATFNAGIFVTHGAAIGETSNRRLHSGQRRARYVTQRQCGGAIVTGCRVRSDRHRKFQKEKWVTGGA